MASSSKMPQLQTPPPLKDTRPISSRLHSSSAYAIVNTQRQHPTNALCNFASKISSSMINMVSPPKIPHTTSSSLPKPLPCFLTHRRTPSKGNHPSWRPPGSSVVTQSQMLYACTSTCRPIIPHRILLSTPTTLPHHHHLSQSGPARSLPSSVPIQPKLGSTN